MNLSDPTGPVILPLKVLGFKWDSLLNMTFFRSTTFPTVELFGKGKLLLLHSLCENWLGSHLSGRERKDLPANSVDLPDCQELQSWDQALQLLDMESWILLQKFPHQAEGVLVDDGLYSGSFFLVQYQVRRFEATP
jgi:hypothetical protein